MFNKIAINIALLSVLSGCATIFNNEPKLVYASGNSEDTFTLMRNGVPMQRDIKLPQTIMVPNGWDTYMLQNSKSEYCVVEKMVNLATFLNIILGGFIGVGIDAATGDLVRAQGQLYCDI